MLKRWISTLAVLIALCSPAQAQALCAPPHDMHKRVISAGYVLAYYGIAGTEDMELYLVIIYQRDEHEFIMLLEDSERSCIAASGRIGRVRERGI